MSPDIWGLRCELEGLGVVFGVLGIRGWILGLGFSSLGLRVWNLGVGVEG